MKLQREKKFMDKEPISEVDEVTIRQWIQKGGMLVNAEVLDIDDPDHIYNQIIAQGGIPEDFGYENPYAELFKDKSRGELINELVSLRKDLESMYRESARW
jgi:hypothetical protein